MREDFASVFPNRWFRLWGETFSPQLSFNLQEKAGYVTLVSLLMVVIVIILLITKQYYGLVIVCLWQRNCTEENKSKVNNGFHDISLYSH